MRVLLVLPMLLAANGVVAQTAPRWPPKPDFPVPPIVWDCRDGRGGVVGLGTRLCLPTSAGPRIAVCDRLENLASWRFEMAACDPARRSGP